MKIRQCLLMLLLGTLVGCGPIYKDFYTFHPADNQQSDHCIDDCVYQQRRCENDARMVTEQCKYQALMEKRICEAGRQYAYSDKKKRMECVSNCYCSENYCSDPDLTQCEQSRVFCHVACGGKVTQTTRCVSFCDQAAPPVSKEIK